MKRCDPNVRAKCPDGQHCELYAVFFDGSECDKFNQKVLNQPMTNGDRIRAMGDEELADGIMNMRIEPCDYCNPIGAFGAECGKDSYCREGILAWLRQPTKEVR